MTPKRVHEYYTVGIFLKALNGILEIAGGILILFIHPASMNRLILIVFGHELLEDPGDFLANYLLRLVRHISFFTKIFGSIYLLGHGFIKLGLVIALLKRKLWAYPAAILVFTLFIISQIFILYYHYSSLLVLITIVDVFIIYLIWLEYKNVRASFGPA